MFDIYVRTFCRKGILGGLKGFNYPYYETSDWIIHARYLLTEIKDDHIVALFDIGDTKDDKTFLCSASWIAALLKKENHFDQVGRHALKGGNQYWSASFYASLLLFNNARSCEYYIEYLQNNHDLSSTGYWDSKPLAVYCLRLYDKNHNTRYSLPYADFSVSKKEEDLINSILRFSDIIRGGIEFTNSSVLQSQLKILVNQTVSPFQYVRGLLNHEPIREVPEGTCIEAEVELYVNKIRKEYKKSCEEGVRYTISEKHPFAKMSQQAEQWLLIQYVSKYLSGTTNPEIIDKLNDTIIITQKPIDIILAIEMDFSLKLPLEIIETCFKKLLDLINPSYQLYELFAIHLLLRGNEKDPKARALFNHSQEIKKNIVWVEEGSYKYPMKSKEGPLIQHKLTMDNY